MTLNEIKAATENEFELNITEQCRVRKNVTARAIFSVLARELTRHTNVEIGNFIERDHATIINLTKKAKDHIQYEPKYRELYLNVKNRLDLQPVKDITIEVKEEIKDRIVYVDFNDSLRKHEKEILRELKLLSDEDILEFKKTRLHPFLGMLKSRKVQGVKVIHGARRNFTLKQC